MSGATTPHVSLSNHNRSEEDFQFEEFIDPFEITSSCVSIILFIPTTVIVSLLIRYHSKMGFRSPFQKIFLICTINDLCCVLTQLITLRLPWWGTFPFYGYISDGVVPTILYYILQMVALFQNIGAVIIALNRASSIGIPQSYDRIWRKNLKLIILFMACIPQLFTVRILFEGARFRKFAVAAFVIDSLSDNPSYYGFQGAVFNIVCSIISFSANLFTGIQLYRHMNKMNKSKRRTEMRFFYLSINTFACQLILTIDQMIVHLPSLEALHYWAMQLFPPVWDFCSLVPVYMLIIVSRDMRKNIFAKNPEEPSLASQNPTTDALYVWYYDEFVDPVEISSTSVFFILYIPTIIIVVLFARFYLKHGFKSNFLKIFLVCSINDLICVLMQLITMRLPWWGVFSFYSAIEQGILPTVLFFLMETAAILQNFGGVVIALNRATSVAMPMNYDKIWNRYLYVFVLVMFIGPVCFTCRIFIDGAFFYKFAPAAYVLQSLSENPAYCGVQNAFVTIFCSIISFIINSYTGIQLYVHLGKMNKSRRAKEMMFYYMSVTILMGQIVLTIDQLLIHLFFINLEVTMIAMQIYPPLWDLCSTLPIYLLIIIHKEFRENIFSFMIKPSTKIVKVHLSTTSNTQFRPPNVVVLN